MGDSLNKLDLGQTITILANLGVIAGIMFLGLELRQNNDQLQSQTRTNLYDMQSQIQTALFSNTGELLDTLVKAENNDELTQQETLQLLAFQSNAVATMEVMFREDSENSRSAPGWVTAIFATIPGARDFFDQTKDRRDADFVRFVEQEIFPQVDCVDPTARTFRC